MRVRVCFKLMNSGNSDNYMVQNLGNVIFPAKKKAPAAAGKTSTGFIFPINSQERHFS